MGWHYIELCAADGPKKDKTCWHVSCSRAWTGQQCMRGGGRQCACPSPQCSCSLRADAQQQAAGRLRPLCSGANRAATKQWQTCCNFHTPSSQPHSARTDARPLAQHARCSGRSNGPASPPPRPLALILRCYLAAGATSRGCHQPSYNQLNYPTTAACCLLLLRRTAAHGSAEPAGPAQGWQAALGGHLSPPPPPTPQQGAPCRAAPQPRRWLPASQPASCAGPRPAPTWSPQ
jgi:hypothetical protein